MKLTRFLLSLLLALFLGNTVPSPSPTPPALPNKIVVVRAYYSDPQMVADLAQWLEPWEVHPKEGYLVVGVTQDEYDRLLKMGFRLEIDQQMTDQLNQPVQRLPQQIGGIPGFPCYRTVAETYASAQALVSAYPHLAAWKDIGDSWEKAQPGGAGSDMMVLQLTNSNISQPKPKLFIMASIHAREYTPAELTTRFAEYLLHNYNINPDVTWLLDYQEIDLLLQANPDGRKLAETRATYDDIMWRKNTHPACVDPNSRGVDLNRNFEFQWGCCGGASMVPCDETFMGAAAASEPETQAIEAYDRLQFPDQRGLLSTDQAPITTTGVFIDLHSYGNLVLWPWGYTYTHAPNDLELSKLGQKFAYFNHYEPEQAIGLYPTSGTTDDFAYGDLGVAAFSFELGTAFSQDCNTFENKILPDNLPALLYAAKSARSPYQTPAGPDIASVVLSPTVTATGGTVQLIAQVDDTRYFTGTGQAQPPVIYNISSAEYTIDAQPWLTSTLPISSTLAAQDGNFDQPREAVTGSIDTSSLGIGRHILYLRARDSAGNWGPFTAAFLYIPTVFLPAISK